MVLFLAVLFLAVSLLIVFKRGTNHRRKITILLFFEVLTILLYIAWLSPSLATSHLETEIALSELLGIVYSLVLLSNVFWHVFHRNIKEGLHTIIALISLVVWAVILRIIGLHTGCPICGQYWFYKWMAKLGLITYPYV